MKDYKKLTEKSQKLEKKTANNKVLVEERKDNVELYGENAQLMNEKTAKYNLDALKLEQHFTQKYRKYLIAFGVIVGSLLVFGFGGYLLTDNFSSDSSNDY